MTCGAAKLLCMRCQQHMTSEIQEIVGGGQHEDLYNCYIEIVPRHVDVDCGNTGVVKIRSAS